MTRYRYTVIVEGEGLTEEQADTVMVERTAHDEDYGFDYTINVEEFSS